MLLFIYLRNNQLRWKFGKKFDLLDIENIFHLQIKFKYIKLIIVQSSIQGKYHLKVHGLTPNLVVMCDISK